MRQIILLLILVTTVITTRAEYNGDSTDLSESMPSTIAGIPLEDAPIIVSPPSGFIYFDGETTRRILIEQFGNEADEVVDYVGMIFPDTLSSMNYLGNCAWTLTYEKEGHVNDSKADKMGFEWIMRSFRDNASPGDKFSWAWTPEYRQDRHVLIIPIANSGKNGSEVMAHAKIFGKDGVLEIERYAPSNLSDKMKKEIDAIISGVYFTEGNRYEDFGPDQSGSTYNSVSAYVKGFASNMDPQIAQQDEEEDSSFFFLSTVIIKGIGIAAGVLLVLMLIFMAIVALTTKKDESSHDITRLGFNVLMRICVFVMVYLLLLVAAIFLIWLGIELTVLVFSHVFSTYLLIAAFGVWALIVGFGYAIIRSLFQFSRSDRKDQIEINEADAPKLFNIIRQTAEKAGEDMPKHVYVSADANACVFYDRPVLSLFMPGRKNLQLGLALPYGLSINELKSILAHEYGHFGQGSMRIGKIVATSYNIAYNIVNAEAFTSHAKLALLTRPLLNMVFGYVQRGYLQLSRAMEYEADEASAKAIGSDIFISALCKTEVTMERLVGYNNIVAGIYKTDHLLPSSYWAGLRMYTELSKKYDDVEINTNVKATGPLTTEQASLVKLKDVWISHPTLRDRINNIKGLPTSPSTSAVESTEGLVSDEVYEALSDLYFELMQMTDGAERNDDKYRKLLKKEMGERMFSASMRPYFDRNITFFDISEVANANQDFEIENPVTERNRMKMDEFTRMISDYQTLMAFNEGTIGEKEIQFDGKVYRRKNAPLEKLLGNIRAAENEIKAIDMAIARMALTKAAKREDIVKAYDDLFYSYAVISHIQEKIIPARNQAASHLGRGGDVDEKQFKYVQQVLIGLRNGLRDFIATLDMSRIEPVLFTDSATHLERLNDEWLCDGASIGADESGYVLGLPEFVISIFNSLIFFSKKKISDTLEDLPITPFWSGTVAAEKATNVL